MSDIVVTVPKTFRDPSSDHVGLLAWAAEGGLPGDDECGDYTYTTCGMRPDICPGERVYVVCEGRLRGYAPLVLIEFEPLNGRFGRIYLMREGGAVAVTIATPIQGFRGWRYRWWPREEEMPFPEWLDDALCRCATCRANVLPMPLFAKEAKSDD